MAVNIIFSHPLGCVKHVITRAKARVITVSTHPVGCEKNDINLQYGQQLILLFFTAQTEIAIG